MQSRGAVRKWGVHIGLLPDQRTHRGRVVIDSRLDKSQIACLQCHLPTDKGDK
jgi:hypothetical protein